MVSKYTIAYLMVGKFFSDEKILDQTSPNPSSSTSNDRKSKLLKIAPKLPFDIDLYHWEDQSLSVPTLISLVIICLCGINKTLCKLNLFFILVQK